MNIFCDTNIIMEYLQQRSQCALVERVLVYAIEKKYNLYISYGAFYTITYLTEKYLKQENLSKEDRIKKLRLILNGIFETFHFAYQTSNSMKSGVNDTLFDDLEDSYQAHIAQESGCNVLLTINERHFATFAGEKTMDVLTPQGFIEKFIQGR